MRGPHTITVYNAAGEVDRHATYTHATVEGVRIEERSGAVASMAGRTSTDGVMIFIPAFGRGYVAPESFVGVGWTLRAGDRIAFGRHGEVCPDHAWVITGVEPIRRVHGSAVSFEVSAR